jgi:hypothetical protein
VEEGGRGVSRSGGRCWEHRGVSAVDAEIRGGAVVIRQKPLIHVAVPELDEDFGASARDHIVGNDPNMRVHRPASFSSTLVPLI